MITFLDGTILEYDKDEFTKYLYNDYTNLNVKLLDEYDLDLSLFSNPIMLPNVTIDEIPFHRFQELLDATSVIIENSKEKKEYLFNIDGIKEFISYLSEVIFGEIQRQRVDNE